MACPMRHLISSFEDKRCFFCENDLIIHGSRFINLQSDFALIYSNIEKFEPHISQNCRKSLYYIKNTHNCDVVTLKDELLQIYGAHKNDIIEKIYGKRVKRKILGIPICWKDCNSSFLLYKLINNSYSGNESNEICTSLLGNESNFFDVGYMKYDPVNYDLLLNDKTELVKELLQNISILDSNISIDTFKSPLNNFRMKMRMCIQTNNDNKIKFLIW